MPVEFVSPAFVHGLIGRVAEARTQALVGFEQCPAPGTAGEAQYWESILEANAACVLRVLTHIRLDPGRAVRYRFYGNTGGELHVRPFIASPDTDVSGVRRLLDWHAPPDATRHSGAVPGHRDAELLYGHFSMARTAEAVFEYWFAMQEIWASTYWAHARVLASTTDLGELVARPGWSSIHPVEHAEPAVVSSADGASRLAVLVYSRIRQQLVTLEQVEIGPRRTVQYDQPVVVATGPKGYVL